MSSPHRRAVAALLLVAALGVAVWLAGFAPHTDDGCQTEIHCLTCRSAYTPAAFAAIAAPADGPAIALAPVGSASVTAPAVYSDGLPSVVSSRGPPPLA
jgi:hypothetical protein